MSSDTEWKLLSLQQLQAAAVDGWTGPRGPAELRWVETLWTSAAGEGRVSPGSSSSSPQIESEADEIHIHRDVLYPAVSSV